MGKLVLFLPDGTTTAINLSKERVVIGRRADNDVCLPYPAVSGEHAAVVTILDDSFLEDLGSTNGTLVNGITVQKHFLRDRDQVDIGQQKLVYLADETAQVEVDNFHSLRMELKTFGERVQKAEPVQGSHNARNEADAKAAEVSGAAARAKPRQKAEVPTKSVAVTRAGEGRGVASVESVASTDVDGERASTDRGLAHIARIRSGESSNVEATGENNGGSTVDSFIESLAETPVSPPAEARFPPARITVLSGPSAGRSLIIERDEVVVGRVGVQVAAIDRVDSGFRLHIREGKSAPLLNGDPLAADGAALKTGDIFEVAGARLEFISQK